MYESINHALRSCDYTVRAPEICPMMHEERAVDSSETIAVG